MNHPPHIAKYLIASCCSLALFTGIPSAQAQTSRAAGAAPATQAGGPVNTPAEIDQAMQMPEGPDQVTALLAAAQDWAKKDPTAALAWAVKLKPALALKIVTPVALVNPPASADWFIQQKKIGYIHPLFYFWARTDPAPAAAWCETAPKSVRYLAFFSVGDGWVKKDRSAATAWAVKIQADEDRLAAIHGVALRLGRDDIAAATAWIKQLPPDQLSFAAKVIAADWKYTKLNTPGSKKADAVKPWLDQLPLTDAQKQTALDSPAPSSNGPPPAK